MSFSDPENHKKFTQSRFDIFFLHKPFSGFYKGNCRQNEEIYTDLKKITQTWFAGLHVSGLRIFYLYNCLVLVLGSAEPPLPLCILMGGGGQEPGRPQPLCPSSIGRQWCWSCQGGGWSWGSYRQWPCWKVWILSVFLDGESEKWARSCGSL